MFKSMLLFHWLAKADANSINTNLIDSHVKSLSDSSQNQIESNLSSSVAPWMSVFQPS